MTIQNQTFYYAMTFGNYQINDIFHGRTKNEVVDNARSLINKYIEYRVMDNSEIIKMVEDEVLEFDLVEINELWPGGDISRDQLIDMYNKYYGG